jgi:hypothetical protein
MSEGEWPSQAATSRRMRIGRMAWSSLIVVAWLITSLPAPAAVAADSADLVEVLSDDQAWSRLPPLENGEHQPLPAWARMLADSLPRTTAAMLEIDALHRAHNPLGIRLAGKVRWTIAQANRCAYSAACAQEDLERAGFDSAGSDRAGDGPTRTSPAGPAPELPAESAEGERLAIAFARRLTLVADTISDEEVARLVDVLGERKLVALVLLTAHANFQDRLLLALGAVADLGAPTPPLAGRFAKVGKDGGIAVPERIVPAAPATSAVPERIDDADWGALDFTTLQGGLDAQRARSGRVRVPTWEEVAETIPAEQRPKHPVRISWTLVCRGYQPQLAAAWSACLRSFGEEAQQDRVFEESVFWVITRTIHCFY